MSSLPGATAKKRGSMPKWEPINHQGSNATLMHSTMPRRRKRRGYSPAPLNAHTAPHKVPMNFDGGGRNSQSGLYVKNPDGSYEYKPGWSMTDATRAGYHPSDVYEIGRTGYYLTLAEARQAIPDGAHGVSYVDDFNDEYQDYYVCAEGSDPEPFREAHTPEPIQ